MANDNTKPAQSDPRIHFLAGWRRWLVWPLALVLKIWGRSLRFDTDEASLAAYTKVDEPVAVVLWHNRLFLVAEVARRYRAGRPVYGLVSASKDGAWLDAFFSMVGIRCVRGSSSKMGREAANALIEVLRKGNDIGITPDGPRGPCYDFKAGGLIVTRRTHTPILLLGGRFHASWRLRSWDRFHVPKPFSKVEMRARILRNEDIPEDRDEAVRYISGLLREINADA